MAPRGKHPKMLASANKWIFLAAALVASSASLAAPLVFRIDGTIDNTLADYAAGQAFRFEVVLDADAARNVRQTPAGTTCCVAAYGWSEDLPAQPNLWDGVRGTGISGNWSFPDDYYTTSSLSMSSGDPARTLWTGDSFQLQSQNIALTQSSGAFANGREILGFQVSAVFLGLSAVNSFGYNNLFSNTLPDATNLFESMVGTYQRDNIFSATAFLNLRDVTGGTTLRFTPNQLTITHLAPTNTVPEPASLGLTGLGLLGLQWARRRRCRK